MITLGQEQRLGRKSFLLLLAKNTTPGFALLVIDLVAMLLNVPLKIFLAHAVATASGQTGADTILKASAAISGIILALLLASLVIIFIGYLITRLVYVHYTYSFEEFDLKLKRGIFTIREVSLPYRQIQDVNVDRSLLYRFLGVSRVIINSAAHEDFKENNQTDIILEPIDKEDAEQIRTILERKIGVQIIEGQEKADRDEAKAAAAALQ